MKKKNDKKTAHDSFGKYLVFASLGAEVGGTIAAASLLGYFLDKWLETTPILLIALVLLGTVGIFVRIVRIMKHLEGRDEDSAQR